MHLVGISGYLERDMRIAVHRGGELEPRFRRVEEPEMPLFFAANLAAVDVVAMEVETNEPKHEQNLLEPQARGGLSLRLTVCNRHMHLAEFLASEGRTHMGGLQEGAGQTENRVQRLTRHFGSPSTCACIARSANKTETVF